MAGTTQLIGTSPVFIVGIVLLLALIIAIMAFWIWMVVDCAGRKFKKSEDKIVWILIIIFLHIIGAIIYYFAIKRKELN